MPRYILDHSMADDCQVAKRKAIPSSNLFELTQLAKPLNSF